MVKICIQGALGYMCRTLISLIGKREDCTVSCGIDARAEKKEYEIPLYTDFSEMKEKPDVIIDFSAPAGTEAVLDYCEKSGTPCVICTTGLSQEILEQMQRLSEKTAVFHSANMSLGVNLIIELAKSAAQILGDDFDIEIIEQHHNRKVDAPSGTALMIADAINQAENEKFKYVYDRHSVRQARSKQEIGIHSVRGGNIVGVHEIMFCGQNETVSVKHSAASRDVFAEGAVNAAVYLTKKSAGLYCMQDLIKQK